MSVLVKMESGSSGRTIKFITEITVKLLCRTKTTLDGSQSEVCLDSLLSQALT